MNAGSTARIVHVNFTMDRSIEHKLTRQAAVCEKSGIPIDFFVFSSLGTDLVLPHCHIEPFPEPGGACRLPPGVIWPVRLPLIARRVDWRSYAGVVLRYPKLPAGWRFFLRRTARPVITEHHTDEQAELKLAGPIGRRVAPWIEHYLRARFLRHVHGIVGVTPELVTRVLKDIPPVPTRTIPNGIFVDDVPETGFVPFDGSTLRVLFVASHFAPWQGLQRMLDGLSVYKGRVFVELTLVGQVPPGMNKGLNALAPSNHYRIRTLGPVYGQELNSCFRQATLAIGSLGLFLKNMEQPCALKVREYMARGIPFLYGYDDPDLSSESPFAVRLENDARPVPVERLVSFAQDVSAIPRLSARMRDYAREHMDWQPKLESMYRFAIKASSDPRTVVECPARFNGDAPNQQ